MLSLLLLYRSSVQGVVLSHYPLIKITPAVPERNGKSGQTRLFQHGEL